MTILQTVIETTNIPGGSPGPEGSYILNGTTINWVYTNATSRTYIPNYTYPDTSTGGMNTLPGTTYLITGSLGVINSHAINIWFRPSANQRILLAEIDSANESNYYHYSMLEIDGDNHIKGRTWDGTGINRLVSTGTVTLNAWNHVYFYYNSTTHMMGMSLNNETEVTASITRSGPSPAPSFLGIGVIDSQNMGTGDRYKGKIGDGGLNINTSSFGSNFASTKGHYGIA